MRLQPPNLALTLADDLEGMSIRSLESSASFRDPSVDCLKNYDIWKRLEGGISSEIYLATCKRGRLKRRTVALKKVTETGGIQGSLVVHQALCHPTILTLFSTLPATDSDFDEGYSQLRAQFEVPTTTATWRYLVLEYCGPHGTLSDYIPRLNPTSASPLEESRIRGVVKILTDALVYLRKENVVHRRLVPESVYITEDFRVKLGGFEDAVKISSDSDNGCIEVLPIPAAEAGVPQYHLAPEINAGLSYACSSDLWSLGLLILWMLDRSRSVRQELISNLDPVRIDCKGELGALISQLLEKIPERRIEARSICDHPFLDPQLPVQNLDPNPDPGPSSNLNPTPSIGRSSGGQQNDVTQLRKLHGMEIGRGTQKKKSFSARRPSRNLESDCDPAGYGGQLPDIIAVPRPSTSNLPLQAAQATRRVVSDPIHGTKERRKFLDPIEEVANEYGDEERTALGLRVRFRSKSVTATVPSFLQTRGCTPTTGDGDSGDQVEDLSPGIPIITSGMEGAEEFLTRAEGEKAEETTEGLLEDYEKTFRDPLPSSTLRRATSSDPIRRINGILDTVVPESHSTPVTSKSGIATRRLSSSPPSPASTSRPPYNRFSNPPSKAMGIGVPRPAPFNTFFLPPQTQKVARGQLVVLPSKLLLVDFREGERRQGREGIEVLTISPDGEEISVFSAPHMSSPCCLIEPFVTYKLGDLPKSYWKLYVDAGKLVEQIKQHIPRLVLYEPDSRFTLMANFPDADVEAMFYSPDGRSEFQSREGPGIPDKTNGNVPLRGATMRIKIMRSRQLVEVSRHVLAPARDRDRFTKQSSKNSPLREKEGEWKKVVLVAPGGNIDTIDRSSFDEYERNGLERMEGFLAVCKTVELCLMGAGEPPRDVMISSDSTSLSSILVHKPLPVDQPDENAPKESGNVDRTRKLGQLQPSGTPTISVPSMGWNGGCHGFPFDPPSLIQQTGGFETRFIPSVGWCVRYAGLSGGAGRYRMMFFDGKTLEVDVDEECVEMMDSVRDEVVRYKIRDCSSKGEIMEKMWAFKEFVSMFDDGSSAG